MNIHRPNLPPPERNTFVEMLFREHHEALYPRAVSMCKQYREDPSLADDLIQSLYEKALTSYPCVRQGYELYGLGYLNRMLFNALNDVKRKKKSTKRLEEIYTLTISMVTSPYHLAAGFYFKRLEKQLGNILPSVEAAIMSFYLQGYSYQEIGELVEMPKNTVGIKIHRAKKAIKGFLD